MSIKDLFNRSSQIVVSSSLSSLAAGIESAEYLTEYCTRLGIDISATASIGDGANDLEMLSHSGMGVAFQGQRLLLDTIPLQLNYTNLLGLLYLQGYSAKEFVVT